MNGAHLHLIVNHVSLFALLFGVVILALNFKWGGRNVLMVAVGLFVLAGVFAWVAHQTGESAEHVFKAAVPDFQKSFIHEHEAAAKFAAISGTIVGLFALVTGWVAYRRPARTNRMRIILFIIALWASSVFVRTTYLGGLIRHTEIRAADSQGS
jgi:hypothetical protein